MENDLLVDLRDRRDPVDFGNKGSGLHWLSRHHLHIPKTHVLTFAGCRAINESPDQFDAEIARAIAQRIDPQRFYAVRSSASLEDGAHHSFAGQLATRTNVRGLEAIQAAIREVLSSGRSISLQPYLQKLGESGQGLEMAVLIQEMVDPVFSGVAFSKNPTTGLDEVVIEAVEGLGERLVQEGMTPSRWIYRWGQFSSRPEGQSEWERTIRAIAVETRRIAKRYGAPVDLEWAFDGRSIFWLQVRPITTLATVPLYSNRISREVLPGVIKPLISSVNIPLVNTAWIRLFDQLLGPTGFKPEDLTRLFHHRAYFNMAAFGAIFEQLGFPRESLEMLLGLPVKSRRPPPSWRTLRQLPRLLGFALRVWNYDRRAAAELGAFEEIVRENQKEEAGSLSVTQLIASIERLFALNIRIAYQNIVIPILMNLYNALLKSQLQRSGIDIVDVDITAGLEELREYDPNPHLEGLKAAFDRYPLELQETLRSMGHEQLRRDRRFEDFSAALEQFLRQFGHLSDSGSDFSRQPWREDPDAILRMAIQHSVGYRSRQKPTWDTLPLSAFARWRTRPIYQRARRFRFRREQVSSIYTASYGRFRVLFGALAERLIDAGSLQNRSDIYYLTWPEIQSLAEGAGLAEDARMRIQARRLEIEDSRKVAPPETIYGNVPPPLAGLGAKGGRWEGIPTSPGYYQGPLTVVRSRDDFEKVREGDVIAIPYSDVAWTPLFARAGAVVAEAGGMLSHSSIVAREYGIPCVVSVNEACSLPENSLVYVDGYQGAVRLVSQNGRATGSGSAL